MKLRPKTIRKIGYSALATCLLSVPLFHIPVELMVGLLVGVALPALMISTVMARLSEEDRRLVNGPCRNPKPAPTAPNWVTGS